MADASCAKARVEAKSSRQAAIVVCMRSSNMMISISSKCYDRRSREKFWRSIESRGANASA
ncbi:MAG: hypothetical protein KJO13_06470 [Gammaproteobacteria bacterium]|nr:hypothetical protein [Gammaproteobacteria bacterium]